MSTAGAIINQTLKILGVLEAGQTASGEESADALVTLNQMVDSWSNEKLMLHVLDDVSNSLTTGTSQYTIGSGGDWTDTRPLRITKAYVQDSDGNDYPMQIINNSEWSDIWLKTQGNSYPRYLYYRPDYPLGQINIWPEPSASLTLKLEVWNVLSTFASLTTSVSLPQGYERAIKYNLAIDLAPEYEEARISPTVAKLAMESKAVIKNVNNKDIPVLISPLARRGRFNVNTGDYYRGF